MTRAPPRHQQRERALSLLYEAELKGEDPVEVAEGLAVPPDPYVRTLLEGAVATPGGGRPPHRRRLGGLAARPHGGHRPAGLRLAVAELLDPDGPPVAVVIDEAVELVKKYSTDESGRVRQRHPLHHRRRHAARAEQSVRSDREVSPVRLTRQEE